MSDESRKNVWNLVTALRFHIPTSIKTDIVLPVVPPEMAHLVSSGDGLVVTVDRESGRERCVVFTIWILIPIYVKKHLLYVFLHFFHLFPIVRLHMFIFCLPGDVLWSQNYGSPVVGVYLYSGDSLRHAPHLTLAIETLRFLTFSSANGQAEAHSSLKWSYQFVKEQASQKTQLV